MQNSSRYELQIVATRKMCDQHGRPRPGHDFHFTLSWDSIIWAQGNTTSPQALSRAIGNAVRDMAEMMDRDYGSGSPHR